MAKKRGRSKNKMMLLNMRATVLLVVLLSIMWDRSMEGMGLRVVGEKYAWLFALILGSMMGYMLWTMHEVGLRWYDLLPEMVWKQFKGWLTFKTKAKGEDWVTELGWFIQKCTGQSCATYNRSAIGCVV